MTTLHALRSTLPRGYVAIPAKNEEQHILSCLEAFAAQRGPYSFEVLLLLNDCTDATAALARGAMDRLPFPLRIHECTLPPSRASAGLARRIAMEQAALYAGPRGILLTTDADSRVHPDWVAANLTAIAEGADAVAGQAEIDPVDAAKLPRELMQDEERVQRLATMLDEIASRLDPDAADPWPRHAQHSGASIAVTAEMFRRAGGIPDVPAGEDRAFFRALERQDARIRHCPKTRVTVSGRIEGRAKGGMADTIRRRMSVPDSWLDECLEPAACSARRVLMRRTARAHWIDRSGTVTDLARNLRMAEADVHAALNAPAFGAAWQRLEEQSSALRRHPIPAGALDAEIRNAADVLYALKARRPVRSAVAAAMTRLAHVV
jgi:GT2 family glycosyltransferase